MYKHINHFIIFLTKLIIILLIT